MTAPWTVNTPVLDLSRYSLGGPLAGRPAGAALWLGTWVGRK